jgi:FkbM family methyltransferase
MRQLLESAGVEFLNGKIRLPSSCSSVRIDVGLSVNAPQSQVWLSRDDKLHVFGFEPVTANRDKIYRGDSPWPINLDPEYIGKRIHIIPCALLEAPNPSGMNIFVTKKDPGCSSVLKPNSFEVDYMETVEVESLKSFLDLFPFDQVPYIDHLKIDVQGADIQVLEGAGRFLGSIMAITVEVDTIEYQNTRNSLSAIEELLAPFGFKLVKRGLTGRIARRLKGIKINVESDDPTFINIPLYKDKRPRNFWAYQRG